MRANKKFLTLALAGILIFSSLTPVMAEKLEGPVASSDKELVLTDLEPGKWYTEAMTDLVEKGILKGFKGQIKPNANITRAEYVQMLYNIMGEEWEKSIHPDLLPGSMDDIKDVKESDWFFKQIRIAMMNGVIRDGYDERLRPNDPLTREEMFVMTVRAFSLEDWKNPVTKDYTKNFKDHKDVSSWSKDSINILLEGKHISGNHENKLLPKKNITRAEASMVISAMKEVKEIEASITIGLKPVQLIKPTVTNN